MSLPSISPPPVAPLPAAPRPIESGFATARLAAGNLLLGTLGVFVVESGQDPVTVVFYRSLIGAMAMALYCRHAGLFGLRGIDRRTALLAALTGVLMAGNWVLFTAALGQVGIALATIVFHVQPFLVVLLGALAFGERLTAARLAWVALAFAGLLAAVGGGERGVVLEPDSSYAAGIACALGGAFLYAWVTLIARRLATVPGPTLTLVQCAVAVPLLALPGPAGPLALEPAAWGWLAGIGLIHTGLVYALIYGALPGLATPVIAVLTFLYPASAVAVDAIVYGRLVDPAQAAGLGLIVLASLGVTFGWSPAGLVRHPARRRNN